MAQFGDAAKKNEEEAKKKRKAEEYDSEEEDEASWERRDAEEQRKKKQKLDEAAKTAQKFIPQLDAKQDEAKLHADVTQKLPVKSVLDQSHPASGSSGSYHNIFGYLAKHGANAKTIDNEGADDKDAKADDAQDGDDTTTSKNPLSMASNASNPSQPLGRSLFDRITQATEDSTSNTDASGFENNLIGDHTWKANTPIKFGASTSSIPGAVENGASASSSKTPFSGLFGAPKLTAAPATSSKPGESIFNNIQFSSPSANVGFGFSPAKPAMNALIPPSNNTSRATSPGATTGESANESAAEGPEEKQEQLDLMSTRAGEENEDVLLEMRVKGLQYNPENKQWFSKGVGPLRVLKHRETGKPRIVLRAEPSGKVVINSGFVKEGNYENIGCRTVAAPIIADGKLGLWRLRVGNDKQLKMLWEMLDENKKFA